MADIIPALTRPVITYGLAKGRDYQATDINADYLNWKFTARRPAGRPSLEVAVSPPGQHNVQNALAAVAVATELGVSDKAICEAMEGFHGVGRRFEIHADCALSGKRCTLVDDYGHHPREIAAVIDTLRSLWPDRRLIMAFQPHRYSRTRDLFDAFVEVLGRVDVLICSIPIRPESGPFRARKAGISLRRFAPPVHLDTNAWRERRKRPLRPSTVWLPKTMS